jgi:hypothetical protein
LLAQLLLRRREYDAALRTAGSLDATEPIGYPMYLPGSLEVRAHAAAALGRTQLAAEYRQRLERLRRAPISG